MNLLEALEAYNKGKKIRQRTWTEGDYISNTKPLRDTNQFATYVGNFDRLMDLVAMLKDDWELFVPRQSVHSMNLGQKFIGPNGEIHIRVRSSPGQNCLNLTTYELTNYINSYELID